MPTCYSLTWGTGYFNRQGLAIKASVSRPRFTWPFVFYSKINKLFAICQSFPPPSFSPFEIGGIYRFAVIKIGSLLRGVVKSAQGLPSSLLARLPLYIAH